jgi:ankyrin repeat protein
MDIGTTEILLTLLQDTRTPLHWAASVGALDVVRYLLDHGAEIDKGDGSNWTPLHIAGKSWTCCIVWPWLMSIVSAGQEAIVRELIGSGADVKLTNDKGLTPL